MTATMIRPTARPAAAEQVRDADTAQSHAGRGWEASLAHPDPLAAEPGTLRGPAAIHIRGRLPCAVPGAERDDIARLSVHLAALARVVLPAAASILDDGPARARELRSRGRKLAEALHWLDRHLTGDAQLARWPTRELTDAVQAAAAEHARAERAVVGALAETLTGPEMVELSKAYHRAALTAPTRPHPSLPARGLAGRVAFTLAARVDGVRDGLDNRLADDLRDDAARALADLNGSERP